MIKQTDFTNTINKVKELQNLNCVVSLIMPNKADKAIGIITKSENEYLLKIDDNSLNTFAENIDIFETDLFVESENICSGKVFVSSYNFQNELSGIISNIYSPSFSEVEECFYRLVIPTKSKPNIQYLLEYKNCNNRRFCLPLKIDGVSLFVYLGEDDYLIIDAETKLNYEKFSNLTFSILIVLGYLTGSLIHGEGYCFTYDTIELNKQTDFSYTTLRPSIISNLHPVWTNPYNLRIKDSIICKSYVDKIPKISNQNLNDICLKVYQSDEFSAILLLIIESNISSLLLRPSGYFVALEGMRELLKVHSKVPIENKKVFKKLKNSINYKVIRLFKSGIISIDDKVTLTKNIVHNLNRAGNMDSLFLTFEKVGFKRPKDDVLFSELKLRNDFLHGKIILDPTNTDNKRLLHISSRIYTLLSILILKYMGYKGYVINHCQLLDDKINEDYFIEI